LDEKARSFSHLPFVFLNHCLVFCFYIVNHDAERWIKSGLRKCDLISLESCKHMIQWEYLKMFLLDRKIKRTVIKQNTNNRVLPLDACEPTLDANTAHRKLCQRGTWGREEQPYPDHPERCEGCWQVLCKEGLNRRSYWESDRRGNGSDRETSAGVESDCWLRRNDKSWSLRCFDNSYIAFHNARSIALPAPSSYSNRVGVHLDWLALCPPTVSPLVHWTIRIHSTPHFLTLFTQGLGLGMMTVCLCQVEQPPIWNSGQNSI
jgi:hypothetical protein